jgi:tetratricopeptide (TPR) repeat protein
MVGLLGMIAVGLEAFMPRLSRRWAIVLVIIAVAVLGFRTAVRGLDWKDEYTLAYHDIQTSSDDFFSQNVIASDLIRRRQFQQARQYAQRSIDIHPTPDSYTSLGLSLIGLGDYAKAAVAFETGLKYQDRYVLYENLAAIAAIYGPAGDAENEQFVIGALGKFPQDGTLWLYLAILRNRGGDNSGAKSAVIQAQKYGNSNSFVQSKIMNNEQFSLTINPMEQ